MAGMQTPLINSLYPAVPSRNINEFNIASNTGVVLHIGNLHKDVNDQKLLEVFGRYGNVLGIRVVRDMSSNQSRGFGFVTMSNQAEAENARAHLNHEKILGKEIIVSLCKKPGSAEVDPRANLIIKNLDKHVTGRDLEEKCGDYGRVVICRVKDDDEGNSLGYGYVQFEKEAEAEECIKRIGEKLFFERQIIAEKFAPLNKRTNLSQKSNLYLKQFPDSLSKEEIEKFIDANLGVFGTITSRGVFADPKINKYYSFVSYEAPDSAAKAIEAMNGFAFPGTDDKLFVGYAQTKIQRKQMFEKQSLSSQNETNLFIRSLKSSVREDEIRKAFDKYGQITSVAVRQKEFDGPVGSEKKILNSAFVNFRDASSASRVMKEFKADGDIQGLLDASVTRNYEYIFYAQPKNIRAQFLKTQVKPKPQTDDPTSMLANPQFMALFMKYMQEQLAGQSQARKARNEGSYNYSAPKKTYSQPRNNQQQMQQNMNMNLMQQQQMMNQMVKPNQMQVALA